MTRASVLIPIHDKPTTLPLTVDTVLRQSVEDLEVLLIGDGVTDEVRAVAERLVAADHRVRFLDFPKGPHHGERHRHDAIEAAASDAIFYLCDDDLLLPDHVSDLLRMLADHDLVHCLNGWVTAAGQVRLYATDLSDPDVRALHLREDLRYNAISITGTAHTRAAYERVARWDTTPDGWWPDHWQFRRMLADGFRAATSPRMTALQFPPRADGRDAWSSQARVDEIRPWHVLVTSPGGQDHVDRLVRAAVLPQLIEEHGRSEQLHASLVQAYDALEWTRGELTVQRQVEAELRAQLDAAQAAAAAAVAAGADLEDEITTLRGHVRRLVELRAASDEKLASLRARLRAKDETIARLRAKLKPQDPTRS